MAEDSAGPCTAASSKRVVVTNAGYNLDDYRDPSSTSPGLPVPGDTIILPDTEAEKFLQAHATTSAEDIQVFYVPVLTEPSTTDQKAGNTTNLACGFGFNCFISTTGAKPYTSAHELGHALGLLGHFDDPPHPPGQTDIMRRTNLVRAVTSMAPEQIGASKRLTQAQEVTIHSRFTTTPAN